MLGVWLALWLAAPQAGFENTLAGLQGRVRAATAREDLERFNQSFDRDFQSAWNARPPAARRDLLTSALSYLGAVRGLGIRGAAAILLAGGYRRVARFQEGIDPALLGAGWTMGPLYGYQNSALILTQLANENPNDPTVRGQLLLDIGRVEALGGSLPILMSVPVGGVRTQREERGIPASALRPASPAAPLPPLPAVPALDIATVPTADQPAARQAIHRFNGTLATARQAVDGLRPLQESVAAMGLTLHPDTQRSLARIHEFLARAKAEIESRRFAESLESLAVAEAEARQALRVVGR
jgi:hypothetical protein